MFFISHRGNIAGRNIERENSPDYIDEAIDSGFDVEIDIRIMLGLTPPGDIYLGHDRPDHEVNLQWLDDRKDRLWLHSKNIDALNWFSKSSLKWNVFWHQTDDYTLTRNGNVWVYPGRYLPLGSICVMPELTMHSDSLLSQCGGICSDNISAYRDRILMIKQEREK